jgi:hypothetical protein
MYMQEPDEGTARPAFGPLGAGVVGLTALATVVFGLLWSPLIEAAENATFFAGG